MNGQWRGGFSKYGSIFEVLTIKQYRRRRIRGFKLLCPQSIACANSLVPGTRTEQNFQSDAQSSLRGRAAPAKGATGIFRFRFKTQYNSESTEPATAIEWNEDAFTGKVDTYGKREIGDDFTDAVYRVHEGFYDNGTTIRKYTRLSDEEVSQFSKMAQISSILKLP